MFPSLSSRSANPWTPPIQFRGIRTSADGSYAVKLTWFLNALGWQDGSRRAGLVYNIQGTAPGGMLTLPEHLIYVARRVGMASRVWQCLADGSSSRPGLPGGPCSAFFAAWFAAPERVFSTASALYACYAAFVLLPIASLSRSPHVAAAASAALLLAVASSTLVGYRLVAHLDATGIEGVHAEMGTGFLLVVWGAAGLGLVATWAMLWGQHLSRSSWMEDGAYREEIEALVDATYAAAEDEDEESIGRAVVERSEGVTYQEEVDVLETKRVDETCHDLVVEGEEEKLIDLK